MKIDRNNKYYVLVDKKTREIILTGGLNHRDSPDLNHADWAHMSAVAYFTEDAVEVEPTEKAILNYLLGEGIETLDEVVRDNKTDLENEIEQHKDLEVKEYTKEGLIKKLRKYNLDGLIDGIQEYVAERRESLNEKTTKGELDWLLGLPEGYLVAISACIGTDCSLTDTMESMLRTEVDYIKVVGKWDGVEETSFLAFTENENKAKALVQTGIYDFNQEDVYVWKAPMTMADITEGTNEGTRLDGKYYYFDLDKIVMKRENVIMESTLNENRIEVMEKYKDIIEDVIGSVEKDPKWLDNLNMLIFDIALDHFERKENKHKAYELIAENWEIAKDQVAELDFDIEAMAAAVAPNTYIGEAIREYIKQNILNKDLEENTKALNEGEGNKMSIEKRVQNALDNIWGIEKVNDYTYIYYYEKSDYRDKLNPETIDSLITSAQSGDLTDAWYDLISNFDGDGYFYEYITNQVVEALEEVAPLTDEELDEVNQLLWDFIDIDYSTYLDDEVPVYIMVDTGDGNYDFTLNPNYSFNWGGETIEDEPLELASLAWLAGTQGYTLDQVLEAFREGRSNSKFLHSIVREGLENSTSMSAVTFLGTMRILDLLNAASGNRDVKINSDTHVGLFDTWSGSGSLFDIELEQGLVIPGNIISRIGTAKGKGDNGYTPDRVYGFSGIVYDTKINLLKDLDRDVLGESKNFVNDDSTVTISVKPKGYLTSKNTQNIAEEIYNITIKRRSNGDITVSGKIQSIEKFLKQSLFDGGLVPGSIKIVKDSLTEADFYGAKQGSEKADDILFALQAHYGLPKYDYDDFRKMNLTQEEVNEVIAYAERDELNKFTYFEKKQKTQDGADSLRDEMPLIKTIGDYTIYKNDDDFLKFAVFYKDEIIAETTTVAVAKREIELHQNDYAKDSLNENKTLTKDPLTEDTITFTSEMRYKDYIIEFFKDTQYGTYHWQAEYDGDDRKLSNFNVWINTRGINLYSEDWNAYPTKANAVYEARKWIDEQKRRWEDPLNENKILTEDITEDNLTIVLNYVFNTEEGGDHYGDSFLYDIDIWKGNEQLYPITKPVYQTHEEMMNGDYYDIDYALREVLQEAYPEYIIEYAGLIGELYDMIVIINCLDEDGNHIDMEVPVQLEEIEDTAWDDETRLGFWA